MDNIYGLAQILSVNYERDIGLVLSLRAGNYAYAVAAKGAEQFSGKTGVVAHTVSYNGYGCQAVVCTYGVDLSGGNLVLELLVKDLAGERSIGSPNSNGYTCFRR